MDLGAARGAGRPTAERDAARRFSLEVGLTRVRATMDSLGNGSFLSPPPLIIKFSILMPAPVTEPEPSLLGEIFGAAENCAGREP